MVDASLQDGSQVFRVGGGKSVLIESNNSDDTNSVLLIPHSSEGRTSYVHSYIDYSIKWIDTL